MSDDQQREDQEKLRSEHEKLRKEFNELRLSVIDHSGRVAGLEQQLTILKSYVDQLKRGV